MISALLMAACGQNQGANHNHSGDSYQVLSGFFSDDKHTIEVAVTAEKPANRIELIAPDGRVFPAERVAHRRWTRKNAADDPGFGVGIFGGNSGIGTAVGIGIPIAIGGGAARRFWTRSEAELTIVDLAAYRADWRRWRIRVTFDDPQRDVIVPAPAPPEN